MTYTINDKLTVLLSTVKGMTFHRMDLLLSTYGTADEVFRNATGANFVLPELTESIKSVMDKQVLSDLFNRLEDDEISVVTRGMREYPDLNFADAPHVLYVKGDLPLIKKGGLAVVGSRSCSSYGLSVASRIGKAAALGGITVISGGAKGIDAAAQKAAIENGGSSIAVLGCGVNVAYPKENKDLFNNILENGALVSEYPPDTPPYQSHFPARNRIISGLCDMLAVVEASVKSGTRSTVTFAQEQGKEIMCVPGNITSEQSQGTNLLIKQGSKILTSPEDIYPFFGKNTPKSDKKIIVLTPDERPVVDALKKEFELSLDELAIKCNNSPSKIAALLTLMELRNIVKRSAGSLYTLNRENEYK